MGLDFNLSFFPNFSTKLSANFCFNSFLNNLCSFDGSWRLVGVCNKKDFIHPENCTAEHLPAWAHYMCPQWPDYHLWRLWSSMVYQTPWLSFPRPSWYLLQWYPCCSLSPCLLEDRQPYLHSVRYELICISNNIIRWGLSCTSLACLVHAEDLSPSWFVSLLDIWFNLSWSDLMGPALRCGPLYFS